MLCAVSSHNHIRQYTHAIVAYTACIRIKIILCDQEIKNLMNNLGAKIIVHPYVIFARQKNLWLLRNGWHHLLQIFPDMPGPAKLIWSC